MFARAPFDNSAINSHLCTYCVRDCYWFWWIFFAVIYVSRFTLHYDAAHSHIVAYLQWVEILHTNDFCKHHHHTQNTPCFRCHCFCCVWFSWPSNGILCHCESCTLFTGNNKWCTLNVCYMLKNRTEFLWSSGNKIRRFSLIVLSLVKNLIDRREREKKSGNLWKHFPGAIIVMFNTQLHVFLQVFFFIYFSQLFALLLHILSLYAWDCLP